MNNKLKKFLSIALTCLIFTNDAHAIVAERIDTDSTAFNGNFNGSNCNNVQECLDTVDEFDLTPDLSGYVPYSGATGNVNLGTNTLTSGALTASVASAGPKIFAYNSSGGGSSLSLGAGSSLSYLQFPSSKTFMLAPVSDITASPSSGDAKFAVDSQSVYIGAYGTLNSEELIVWGDIAIGDNGTNNAQSLRFYEPSSSGSNYTGFKAQAQSGNINYTLPLDDGDAGEQLQTNGSGSLSWESAGFTLPSLTAGSILFSDGSTIAEDNKFFFDDTNNYSYLYTTLGSERVTNGTFTGSASGWTVGSGWAYSSNTVIKNSNGTATLSQTNVVSIGLMYELTYTISGWSVGSVTPSIGAVTLTARSADGTYTERFLASTTAALTFTPTNTARFTIDGVSVKQMTGGSSRVGGTSYSGEIIIGQSASNSGPGTTKHLTFANPGSYTWTEYRFGSNSMAATIGVNSSGDFMFTGSSGTTYWRYGTTSPTQFSYTYSGGLVHSGVGAFGSGIHAGSQGITKSSMLTVAGGTGLKTKYVYTSQTLDDTATEIYARPDLSSSCTGTASTACSTYSDQGSCEARSSHGGGCSWAGINCADYNYSGEGTCESYAGCTYSEANCSDSGWYDQYSCEVADDSYGGSCAYNVNYEDCSSFNPTDQWTCEGNSGCSWYDNSCSSYNGDEGTCLGNGCYYDSGSTNCVGVCSGSYESGTSCDGTYFTGECSGSGGTCSGTPSCIGINNSTDCGNETGCTWSTGLSLTLPADGGSSTFYRTYWIHNGAAATALTILPNTDQTVNYTTSLSIPALDSKKLTFFYFTQDCSTWSSTNESTCETGHTGCTWTDCSVYTEELSCGGTCSWVEGVCTGAGNCEGTWVITRNWAITADFT